MHRERAQGRYLKMRRAYLSAASLLYANSQLTLNGGNRCTVFGNVLGALRVIDSQPADVTRPLAEEIDVHADSRPFWTPDLSAFVIGFKRFLFNVLLFLGSLPEEYEPEKVVRPAREKKGRFRPELRAARFLGKEAYRPARRPTGAEHEPTGRELRQL